MFSRLGFWELLLIFLIVLLLFGARYLPELGRAMGRFIFNLRKEGGLPKDAEPPSASSENKKERHEAD